MLLRLYSRKANSNLKQAAQNHNNFFLSDRTIQTKTNSRTFYFCSYNSKNFFISFFFLMRLKLNRQYILNTKKIKIFCNKIEELVLLLVFQYNESIKVVNFKYMTKAYWFTHST